MTLYTGKELVTITNISIATLRKWEKQGLLKPIKLPSGHKRYTNYHKKVIEALKKERGSYFS